MFKRLLPIGLAATFAGTIVLGATLGCGGSKANGKVSYSVTAKKNYELGVEELKEKDWVAAAKYFSFIKARFPYSKFAVLAELRMNDAEFGAGHYLQAIDGYKLFAKFHPTHDMVVNGYSAFRVGEAYYKMLPSDFWLLPPSHEKDQSATSDAHRELARFIKKFPSSPYRKDADEKLAKINRRLAAHEMYVARFYWERDKPMGTVLRLRRLLKKHKGTRFDGDALYLLGRAYIKVNMPKRAATSFEQLLKQFPKHKNAGDAKAKLSRLSRNG